MINNQPKVSIALITYNHEAFVTQAIESILMQGGDIKYEIVVSDDCSTDNTPNILRAFQEQFPDRIRLFLNSENIGMHRNWAQALQNCQGEYIALLEGDDYWLDAQKLVKQVQLLEYYTTTAICFHNALVVHENDQQPSSNYCPADQKQIPTVEDLFQWNCIPTASVMYRRSLLPCFPDWFFKLSVCDFPLYILLGEQGEIRYLNQVMSVYRKHPDSVWASKSSVWRMIKIIELLNHLDIYLNFRYKEVVQCSLAQYYQNFEALVDQVSNLEQFTAQKDQYIFELEKDKHWFVQQLEASQKYATELTEHKQWFAQQLEASQKYVAELTEHKQWFAQQLENSQQEVLQAKAEIEQLSAHLTDAQDKCAQLQRRVDQLDAKFKAKQNQLLQVRSRLKKKNLELRVVLQDLQQAEVIIEGMSNSKFWKLRNAWLKLRQKFQIR